MEMSNIDEFKVLFNKVGIQYEESEGFDRDENTPEDEPGVPIRSLILNSQYVEEWYYCWFIFDMNGKFIRVEYGE